MKRALVLPLGLLCALGCASAPTVPAGPFAGGAHFEYRAQQCELIPVGLPRQSVPCTLVLETAADGSVGQISVRYLDRQGVSQQGGEKHSGRAILAWMERSVAALKQPPRNPPSLESADDDDKSWQRNVHDGTAVLYQKEGAVTVWMHCGDRATGIAKFPDDGSLQRFHATVTFASAEAARKFFSGSTD